MRHRRPRWVRTAETERQAGEAQTTELPDLEDLPPKWQLIAAGAFFLTVAAFLGVPWWLGHPWLLEHLWLVGPLLGASFFGATERYWLRRAGLVSSPAGSPSVSAATTTGATSPGRHRSLVRMRRRAGWVVLRSVTTMAAIVVMVFVVWPAGDRAVADNYRIIDTQPHHNLRVVAVHQHTLEASGPSIVVFVPGDGNEELLYPDYLHPEPSVGDIVEAVIDPEYTGDVIPVAYKTSGDNGGTWTELLLFVGLLAMIGYLGWFYEGATSLPAALTVLRAAYAETVEVVETQRQSMVVQRKDGTRLRWALSTRPLRVPPVGTVLTVSGPLAAGGRAAAAHRDWVLWTASRLTHSP